MKPFILILSLLLILGCASNNHFNQYSNVPGMGTLIRDDNTGKITHFVFVDEHGNKVYFDARDSDIIEIKRKF